MASNSTSFRSGQSGNPAGRPKLVQLPCGRTIVDLARDHSEDAIATLVSIAKDGEAPAAARVSAASALLDRGWGKPSLPIEVAADESVFEILSAARRRAGLGEFSGQPDAREGSQPV